MEVIASGQGDYRMPDLDGFRQFVRDNKPRTLVDKVMSAHDAIERFVQDGAYLAFDGNLTYRGPGLLFREIIRQRKKDLCVSADPGTIDVPFLVAGGCVGHVDVGWMDPSPVIQEAIKQGRLKVTEWSNGALSYRHLAGAMGVPFIPMRAFGGTDAFEHSGAKLVKDPYTGGPVVLVPALQPDVTLVHAHQADKFGNTRVFGPGFAPWEKAASAKRVIVSVEEIIEHEEIRRRPGLTTLPYYLVDAVVHAPLGAYPGPMPGMYQPHGEHMADLVDALRSNMMEKFLDKWVHSVANDEEMLARHVEAEDLSAIRVSSISEAYGI